MINIPEMVDKHTLASNKVFACHTNRASSIGDPCERRLVYQRTNWKDAEKPNLGLLRIFEEGRDTEDAVMRKLAAAQIRVTGSQMPLEIPAYEITGHPDGFIFDEESGQNLPLDIKSSSPFVFAKLREIEDLERFPWTKKYRAQLHVYMKATETNASILLFVNKTSAEYRQFVIEYDAAYMDELLAKAARVNAHVKAGSLPDRIKDYEECDRCPFRALCAPDVEFKGVEVILDSELEAQLVRRAELAEAFKEYNEIDETVKEKIKKSLGDGTLGEKKAIAVGEKSTINASWTVKQPYSVKGTSYWTLKIKENK